MQLGFSAQEAEVRRPNSWLNVLLNHTPGRQRAVAVTGRHASVVGKYFVGLLRPHVGDGGIAVAESPQLRFLGRGDHERNAGVIPRRPIAITAAIMFAPTRFIASRTVTTVATGTVLQIQRGTRVSRGDGCSGGEMTVTALSRWQSIRGPRCDCHAERHV